MKANKTLIAASVLSALAVAGAADAATVATYDVAGGATQIMFHFPAQYSTPSTSQPPVLISPAHDQNILTGVVVSNGGTAVLDDSGTLTLTGAVFDTATSFGTHTLQTGNVTFLGNWNGTSFAPTSGSFVYSTCADLVANPALATCSNNVGSSTAIGVTFNYASVSGPIGLGGGTISGIRSATTSDTTYAFNLTPTAPAVPVPAAAWLFGSGLMGLFGAARRRRSA